jgi:excisionase family DNA binding protein
MTAQPISSNGAKQPTNGRLGMSVGDADSVLLFDNQPNKPDSAIELLTIQEAARFLTISASGMRRLQQGRLVPFFKVRGSIRFAKRDLVSYLARQRVGAIGT